MIKLNRKQKSPKTKVKLPKIEINECKMKTRDQKKLENEMFQQANEARIMLERLLSEQGNCEDYGISGRARSNSLNATMENLLLSKHKADLAKCMKPRGSVPNIASHITRKLFFRSSKDNSANTSPQPTSPASSPESPRAVNRSKMNPLKFIRKHAEADINTTNNECTSPKNKRICETTANNASCTSYKTVDDDNDVTMEETKKWNEQLI